MKGRTWIRRPRAIRSEIARKDDFVRVFEAEESTLMQLALLLTGDTDTANVCLARALMECNASGSVSKDWIIPWVRRSVIRSAIELTPASRDKPSSSHDQWARGASHVARLEAPFDEVLRLPELDRFVLVLCVVESYSVLDCALLLNRQPRLIFDALQRASGYIDQVRGFHDRTFQTARP